MSRVRGKKRIEIIQKFLEGEEDPEYEVIPTVTEGKYFVRPRKAKSKKERQSARTEMNEEIEGEEEIEEPKPKLKQEQEQKVKPKQEQEQRKQKEYSNEVFYDPTVSYQILEQLKLLGEEQRLKREKKEQKKLVKHQIRKQLKKKEPEPESDEDYDYEVVEEEPKVLFKPTPIRRRVNLCK